HFISYEGDRCERLHGHNYRAEVEIDGQLDPNHYLLDFIAFTRMAKAITDELDHHMLLAARNSVIRIEETPELVRVACRNRHWEFRARTAFYCRSRTRQRSYWRDSSASDCWRA